MRPIHLEEIARRFPKITLVGAHCGNPEYEWAAGDCALEPERLFRPKRLDAYENARPSRGIPTDFLVVGHRLVRKDAG